MRKSSNASTKDLRGPACLLPSSSMIFEACIMWGRSSAHAMGSECGRSGFAGSPDILQTNVSPRQLWGPNAMCLGNTAKMLLPRPPVCLIVGNEIEGVSSEIIPLCDAAIDIEMAGVKNSLNVSVAFGVAACHLRSCLIKNDGLNFV